MNNFLFVAAENDAISNCKAGGMGDVVRDVPRQISERGDKAHVVTPSYSRLHQNATFKDHLNFRLRGENYTAELYEVKPKRNFENISHFVIHHPEIKAGDIAHIYHNDLTEPFFTDAVKFFIFCTAVAEAIKSGAFGKLDVVHLHDWHASLVLFLRRFHPAYNELKAIRFVYTIHNLAIQGIRPFSGSYSSVENWFPEMEFNYEELQDPRFRDCINLMAIGIRFADAVHTVSPSYKEDILKPSAPPEFIGGEGLQEELKQADNQGRLFGILNGSNYSDIDKVEKGILFRQCIRRLFRWLQEEKKDYKAHYLAHTGEKLTRFQEDQPDFICASIARLTEQKFYFFKQDPDLLPKLMEKLNENNGVFILLGTGAPEYEFIFRTASYQHKNFIFINAQSESIIDMLYQESDLYLMPSLFEPCGISQMLAMRNGQPCLVHHTGGLKDTVIHGKTGFSFTGDTLEEKKQNFVKVFSETVDLFFNNKKGWKRISANAKRQKFTWKKSVDEYYKYLYSLNSSE